MAKEIDDGEKHRVVEKCGRMRMTRQKVSGLPKSNRHLIRRPIGIYRGANGKNIKIKMSRRKKTKSSKISSLGQTTDRDCKSALHFDKEICHLIKQLIIILVIISADREKCGDRIALRYTTGNEGGGNE